jgi:hypothetical protein
VRALDSPDPEAILRGYFCAKDESRPHLLREVFAPDAELIIGNKSSNIEFPAASRGREAIAGILVRDFCAIQENVYSFYLARPSTAISEFTCDWLVGMSERASRQVRVGCGSYRWSFQAQAPFLASRLAITIEVMQVLPAEEFEPVFAWLGTLNYPWASAASVLRRPPNIEALSPVMQYVGRNASVA